MTTDSMEAAARRFAQDLSGNHKLTTCVRCMISFSTVYMSPDACSANIRILRRDCRAFWTALVAFLTAEPCESTMTQAVQLRLRMATRRCTLCDAGTPFLGQANLLRTLTSVIRNIFSLMLQGLYDERNTSCDGTVYVSSAPILWPDCAHDVMPRGAERTFEFALERMRIPLIADLRYLSLAWARGGHELMPHLLADHKRDLFMKRSSEIIFQACSLKRALDVLGGVPAADKLRYAEDLIVILMSLLAGILLGSDNPIALAERLFAGYHGRRLTVFLGAAAMLWDHAPHPAFASQSDRILKSTVCVALIASQAPPPTEVLVCLRRLLARAARAQTCAFSPCGAAPGRRLQRCGGCRAVRYCDRECQRRHWHAHRPLCGLLREIFADTAIERMSTRAFSAAFTAQLGAVRANTLGASLLECWLPHG